MAGFYAARISTTPTLQWMVLSPPYTAGWGPFPPLRVPVPGKPSSGIRMRATFPLGETGDA